MTGLTMFFAATQAEREASGDERPSIEERYEDRRWAAGLLENRWQGTA